MEKSVSLRRGLIAGFALLLAGTIGLFGCSQQSPDGESQQAQQDAQQEETATYPAIDITAMDFEYSSRDLDSSYDEEEATFIELAGSSATVEGDGARAEGTVVTVSEAGTYIVSGSLDDGQLVVDASAEDKVQLVLDGVSIYNADGPAILVSQADKCFITLAADSQNELSDGTAYTLAEGEDEPNAVVFSKDDLTLNGSGSLEVTANYRHAINSKDDLVITGGTYAIDAVEDALRGKDCVKVRDGSFQIEAGEDAIKSSNDTEADRGFVCIDGGMLTINAGDDAVHAETVLKVNEGTITIEACEEGYEAEQVYINGANSHITSNDDALNASARGGSSSEMMPGRGGMGRDAAANPSAEGQASAGNDCLLQINGGYLVIDAGGDGLDSNGTLEMNGGVVLLSGPTDSGNGAIDYDSQGILTGGTLIAVGSAGMAQGFSEMQQPMVSASVSGQAGQSVALADADGNVLACFIPAKGFQMVQATAPEMQDGATYSIVVSASVAGANADGYASGGSVTGGSTTSVEASTQAQGGNGGGPGAMGPRGAQGGQPGRGGQDAGMPFEGEGEPPEPPEGTAPQSDVAPPDEAAFGGERDGRRA